MCMSPTQTEEKIFTKHFVNYTLLRNKKNYRCKGIFLAVTYLKVAHALAEGIGAAELVGVVVRGAPVVLVFAAIGLLWA